MIHNSLLCAYFCIALYFLIKIQNRVKTQIIRSNSVIHYVKYSYFIDKKPYFMYFGVMNGFKTLFLSIAFLFSSYTQAVNCSDLFSHLQKKHEFKEAALRMISLGKQNNGRVRSSKKLSSEQKESIKNSLLKAMFSENFKRIETLSKEQDFLKKRETRYTPEQLAGAKKYDKDFVLRRYNKKLFPRGVSPLQWAVTEGKYKLFEQLLDLSFNYRSIGRSGGHFMENNPLHLAIQKGEYQIAEQILKKESKVDLQSKDGRPFGPRRLIDEKGIKKQTPWVMTLLSKDEGAIEFMYLLAKHYGPSHHVKSEHNELLLTNYEWAVRLNHRLKFSRNVEDLTRYFQGNNPYKKAQSDLGSQLHAIKVLHDDELKDYLDLQKFNRL